MTNQTLTPKSRAAHRGGPGAKTKSSKHIRLRERHARWMFAPSMLLMLIFVYGFIGATLYVSFSKWRTGTSSDLSISEPFYATYQELIQEQRFQAGIRNITVFTVLFLLAAVLGGLILALIIHHIAKLNGLFRAVYMMPYALSFIVTGVVWRWIFNPSTGVNKVLTALGIENPPGWTTDTTILWSIFKTDGSGPLKIDIGIPVALIPIVVAAAWQLSGFAMSIFLAGLASVPEEQIEASNLDGAGAMQRLRYILLPQLLPSAVTAFVLLMHVALKIFDLVMAMSGSGPAFVTDVPGIYIYEYLGSRYNKASAMSIVLLVLTLFVIVPYLVRSYRKERNS